MMPCGGRVGGAARKAGFGRAGGGGGGGAKTCTLSLTRLQLAWSKKWQGAGCGFLHGKIDPPPPPPPF